MLNHNYIGAEHLLLGLIHEGKGVAATALESLGISLDATVQRTGPRESNVGQLGARPLTQPGNLTGHVLASSAVHQLDHLLAHPFRPISPVLVAALARRWYG